MSKKRPRVVRPSTKLQPAYWGERLFKNTYTYKGRRVEVRGWRVKIQLLGKRKTFSLSAGARAQAAGEACQVYQAILAHGWESTARGVGGSGPGSNVISCPLSSPASIASDVEYWRRRLVHRRYPEERDSESRREFSVRIDHGGTGQYFPLGTCEEPEAAARAMRIYQAVLRKGWGGANAVFPRELTLALRWVENPVAWTYTTIHTGQASRAVRQGVRRSRRLQAPSVVIIEPDEGIRSALVSCVSRQSGFRCEAAFASWSEALGKMSRRNVDLILANHDFPSVGETVAWGEIQRVRPGLMGVFYSVFEDADELFKAAPGGAIVYMLKRNPPFRIFDAIAGLTPPVRREQAVTRVRDYFERLASNLTSSTPSRDVARLSPRERQILALLSRGAPAKEIADALAISVWTVQGHVKSIFEKLKVHSRIEAVVRFLQK